MFVMRGDYHSAQRKETYDLNVREMKMPKRETRENRLPQRRRGR
jgi:hypothetical protein